MTRVSRIADITLADPNEIPRKSFRGVGNGLPYENHFLYLQKKLVPHNLAAPQRPIFETTPFNTIKNIFGKEATKNSIDIYIS